MIMKTGFFAIKSCNQINFYLAKKTRNKRKFRFGNFFQIPIKNTLEELEHLPGLAKTLFSERR